MRITGGQHKGRVFDPPKLEGFRPTMEKVRLAVFSMLNSQMELAGCKVLDCYSGSGAFGLESLSRGAAHCTFIEKNSDLIKFSASVADKLGILRSAKFIRGVLPAELNKLSEEFDLIFSDPPYDSSPGDFLVKLLELRILKLGGLLVFETAKSNKDAVDSTGELYLESLRDKTYGDTRVRIFRKKVIHE